MYIGNSAGMERSLVPNTGIPTYLFAMAPPTSVRGVILLVVATLRALLLIARLRPKVTFATGGYVSVPAAVASWIMRVPLVLFLPDVVPGNAVRRLVPLAVRVAVSTDATLHYLPARKVVVTGYPVRETFLAASRDQGRRHFSIPPDATVLCAFGGSLGSRSINDALAACLPQILSRHYVIHICGEKRLAEARGAAGDLSAEERSRYLLFPYLQAEEMASAMAAADLALCRSGASTIGELPATGTSAILVPLPEPRVHQRENAEYVAGRGGAVVIDDSELRDRLGPELERLLNDRAALERMCQAARALARPDAARAIAALVLEAVA